MGGRRTWHELGHIDEASLPSACSRNGAVLLLGRQHLIIHVHYPEGEKWNSSYLHSRPLCTNQVAVDVDLQNSVASKKKVDWLGIH